MDTTAFFNPGIQEITRNEENYLYLTRFLDEVTDAIIATDMAFGIIYWNKAAEQMFGWTAHQALGQNLDTLLKTELISMNHAEAVQKLMSGTAIEVEAVHTCRDGSRINVISKVSASSDINGTQIGTIGVIRDVTDRKRVEDLLWKNKERESFLLKLSDTLRSLSDPDEIDEAVTGAIMAYLDSDRCFYCEIIDENAVIRQDAKRDNLPSLSGVYPLSSFPIHKSPIEAGLPFSISDVYATEVLGDDLRQLCILKKVISCLVVPVVKNEKPVGILCIVQSVPRNWTKAEEELIVEIAERTWAAVERAKAEDALAFHANLLSSVHDAIVATNEKCMITYWNGVAEEMFGWKTEEMIGKPAVTILEAIFPNSTHEDAIDNMADINFYRGEVVCHHKDGHEIDILVHTNAARDHYGNPIGSVSSLRDITERKKAEKELQESLKREAYLLQLSDTLRPLEDQEEILTATMNLLADYLKTAQVSMNEWHDETNEAYPYTISLLHSNKVFSIANTFTSPLLGADERNHYMDLNVCSCIIAPNFSNGMIKTSLSAWQTTPREWTAAEENLVKETAERLWESLERAVSISIRKQTEELLQKNNEALERSIEMKDEFLSLISHEFRTPLTVIISAIQMLKTFAWNELSDKAKGYYNTIRQNSNRQLKLVNNILDITKVNAGSFELHATNSDIVQLTRFIIESIEPYADRKKINVAFLFNPRKFVVGIDEEKYERILLNLLSNAIKYTPKGKTITVKVHRRTNKKKNMVCVQVSDDGVGIPPDKQEHIFERFGQIDNVLSRQTEGTGIGLHLTRMFVEMLGGEIKIASKPGEGSTFTVLLPAAKVNDTPAKKAMMEMTDNRTIQLTEIEFSDIYFDK